MNSDADTRAATGTRAKGEPSWAVWIGTAIAFVLAYFAARAGLELWPGLPVGVRLLIAALPLPFFAAWLLVWTRGIRAMDELERRIQLEALAFAFPLTVLLLMALGMAQLVVTLPPEDLSYRHVWAMVPIFYFLGVALARRRYQ